MAEMIEEEKYARKSALLKKAMAEADIMDTADVNKTSSNLSDKTTRPVYEHTPGQPMVDN